MTMAEGRNAALAAQVASAVLSTLVQTQTVGAGYPPPRPAVEQQAVAKEVAEKVVNIPEIKHLASTESPWRSRAHWAMVVSLVAPVLALGGLQLAPEYLDGIAQIGWLAANAVAAYLAYRARTATRPLGE
jgi:hypothetical protein